MSPRQESSCHDPDAPIRIEHAGIEHLMVRVLRPLMGSFLVARELPNQGLASSLVGLC
jgi:hypothetical protein